ncbi:MAG: hypothetical protein ACRD63_02275 [Pyrinomonadaceae bacterium]
MKDKLIKVTEAQKLLGVSKKKMASLIAERVLEFRLDPLDKRVKLVKLNDVERLIIQKYGKAA